MTVRARPQAISEAQQQATVAEKLTVIHNYLTKGNNAINNRERWLFGLDTWEPIEATDEALRQRMAETIQQLLGNLQQDAVQFGLAQ